MIENSLYSVGLIAHRGRILAAFLACMLPWPAAGQSPEGHMPALVRENLGPNVNSQYDEVLPIIAADSRTLYFVRKDSPDNIGASKADIWFSERLADGSWSPARNIDTPLNTNGYDYVCYALPDNNSLLLGNQYLPDGSKAMGISMSFRGAKGWKQPINLTIDRFVNKSEYCEYTMSPDGRVLIMSILADSTLGKRDLYFSMLLGDSAWSQPRNLGRSINSDSTDITPFLAADGKTLYFSSNRAGGFGSNDIYVSRRLDDSWTRWSPPQNLGYPINTSGWDAYYTVPAKGDYAYFVSTQQSLGKGDIFRIKLPEDLKPTPVLIVSGTVKNPRGEPVAARVFYQRLSDGSHIGSAVANPATGEYSLALPAGENFEFHAEHDGYYPVSENMDLRELAEYREARKDLVLVPIERGTTVRLNNIFFDFDRATLRSESIPELDRLVAFLVGQPKMRVQIGGHTDNVGGDEYNLVLSQSRAQAVVDYLIAKGIAASRLDPKGYGKTRPVDTNDSDQGRQNNRRVEFTIL
jgi:outer membrane protein OmpA-like peptidoglycan-associated protein